MSGHCHGKRATATAHVPDPAAGPARVGRYRFRAGIVIDRIAGNVPPT